MAATLSAISRPPAGKSASSIKKEKQATARDIKKTTVKIKENDQSTARQLNRLEQLRRDIGMRRASILKSQASVDSLNAAMASVRDSITAAETDVERLRGTYRRIMQKLQGRQSAINRLTFIFASGSFSEAVARVRYLRQFNKWRTRRTNELRDKTLALDRRRRQLENLIGERNSHLAALTAANARVEKDHNETASIISSLKSEGSRLRAHLAKQKERLAALDRELDRLIAEEQKRRDAEKRRQEEKRRQQENKRRQQQTTPGKTAAPAPVRPDIASTAVPSDSPFARMKGRLPFPLDGKCRIISHFGRHPHPDVPGIETDNSGIDVEVISGGNAKAIYDGEVSAVFRQPGYNHIVMVRHGEYIAIYAGLSNLTVKKGDKLKTGQKLGTVDRDPERDNRLILHFELRHERTKLNPLAWVRR